ncbi:MAG: hypothetical protein WD451_05810 [Thermoanaerobaculia bacterium]
MKKTLMTCLAIAMLLALAGTASAITCTVDQRPGATLLVPYFQVSVSGTDIIGTGPDARDTIVTIANASSAPMIAHVNVYNRYSELILDFNIALTGFDVQAMRMSDVISGLLPVTVNSDGDDTCQRNSAASVFPDPDGFLRVRPVSPATTQDNTLATTQYQVPAFGPGFGVISGLSEDCDGDQGPLAFGYITIDHANYCNLSNPVFAGYYINDAIGNENNLWGEIIFTSGTGIPTYAMSTVNLESDSQFSDLTFNWINGADPVRTFYARYVDISAETDCNNCTDGPDGDENNLNDTSPWNHGFGDTREPLGLKYAARWFDLGTTITSNFRVWRGSLDEGFGDFCDDGFEEPVVSLTFYDEDENTVTSGTCPSPCEQPQFNFPLETQQRNISDFQHPTGVAGWVSMNFVNLSDGTVLDQAWVDYSFESDLALETILVPGTQLDPSTCNPLGVAPLQNVFPVISDKPTGTGS